MMNFISKKFLGVMAALVIFAVPAFADITVGVERRCCSAECRLYS